MRSSAEAGVTGNATQQFSRSEVQIAATQMAPGGKASLQPKRTPMSNEEIEAILLSYQAAKLAIQEVWPSSSGSKNLVQSLLLPPALFSIAQASATQQLG
ncbi:hypothetical protein RJ641_001399 [Dillenia turbinata]|uniref:Uncharacterized protein n=1 Tax=Dillenia turbinata TaxID=194707 RepID=A0AAN8ZRZ8_9MAGN